MASDELLSQNDLDALFGELSAETDKPIEAKEEDGTLSQNDLDALFGELSAEADNPIQAKEEREVKDIENLEGGETLSQDQIDDLLKSFLGD